jgi:predicted nucleotidyltransferase
MVPLIEQQKEALVELCRKYKVLRLDLFGSAATDTFDSKSSDLDFVVTFSETQPGTYADRYLGLAEELEQLFHRRVDVVTERSIRSPYFRHAVEATRQPVYDQRSEETVA